MVGWGEVSKRWLRGAASRRRVVASGVREKVMGMHVIWLSSVGRRPSRKSFTVSDFLLKFNGPFSKHVLCYLTPCRPPDF